MANTPNLLHQPLHKHFNVQPNTSHIHIQDNKKHLSFIVEIFPCVLRISCRNINWKPVKIWICQEAETSRLETCQSQTFVPSHRLTAPNWADLADAMSHAKPSVFSKPMLDLIHQLADRSTHANAFHRLTMEGVTA